MAHGFTQHAFKGTPLQAVVRRLLAAGILAMAMLAISGTFTQNSYASPQSAEPELRIAIQQAKGELAFVKAALQAPNVPASEKRDLLARQAQLIQRIADLQAQLPSSN